MLLVHLISLFLIAQTSYIRPLVELIRINTYNKEKPTKEHNNQLLRLKMDLPRSRIKSKALNVNCKMCLYLKINKIYKHFRVAKGVVLLLTTKKGML